MKKIFSAMCVLSVASMSVFADGGIVWFYDDGGIVWRAVASAITGGIVW